MFESGLAMRVYRKWLKKGELVIGQEHHATIYKTKVGPSRAKDVDAIFHTSNGAVSPEGFDLARDVVTLGLHLGVLVRRGTAYAGADGEVLFEAASPNDAASNAMAMPSTSSPCRRS